MKEMSVLALAAMSVAGVVRSSDLKSVQGRADAKSAFPSTNVSVETAPDGSFRDECGFRYNSPRRPH